MDLDTEPHNGSGGSGGGSQAHERIEEAEKRKL